MTPPKQGNDSAREAGRTSEALLLGGTTCWNCGEQGHYSSTCPKPRKPRSDTPTRYDKSKTAYPAGQRTANVANVAKPEAEKRVEFATGGNGYWAAVAVRRSSTRWIRRDRAYMIRMNFLVEDVPGAVPGPDILMSGDVERNPGPTSPVHATTISVSTIVEMKGFKDQSLLDREKKAREEGLLHPCIIYEDKGERVKFRNTFEISDGTGSWHDQQMLNAFADLAVSPPCADTSFMLMMNRAQMRYQESAKLDTLRQYEPLMRHVVGCLSGVLRITLDASLDHMLMACVQHRLEEMHNPPSESPNTQVVPLLEPSLQNLADMVRLSLAASAGHRHIPITPEGFKAALVEPDQLGLGGTRYGQDFMAQVFEQRPAPAHVEVVRSFPPCPGCAASPGPQPTLLTPVAVTVTVHQAPSATPVQMYTSAHNRVTRSHPTGVRQHEEPEQVAHTPIMARGRITHPSVEYVGEFPSSTQPYHRLVRGRPSSQMCKGGSEESQDEEINTPSPAAKTVTPAPFQGVSHHEVTKRHRVTLTPVAEAQVASGRRRERDSIPDGRYNTEPLSRAKKKAEWGVDRDVFRGVLKSNSNGLPDHLIQR